MHVRLPRRDYSYIVPAISMSAAKRHGEIAAGSTPQCA
jgi:hypothetical protein